MGMEIEEGLRRWFGHESFRSGQREAVEAVLDGHDVVVVMPTGSGKSLCYQLAAMLLPGTTLVISPLIALMKDQVDGLTRRGCPATFLNSTLTAGEMGARLAKMVKGEYKLVYIAPERFLVERFMQSKCPVVVATNAFGMGVDRADIRFVLHWDMPGGIEAYYQEIGRAGRDGQAAWCELLFNHGDVKIQEFFNEGSNPTWHQATQVLDALKRLEKGVPTTIDTDQFGKDIGIMNGIAVDTILNVLQSQGVLTRTTMRRGGRLTSVQLNSDVDVSGLEKVFETRREDLSFSVTHPKDWNQPSRGDVRCLKSN